MNLEILGNALLALAIYELISFIVDYVNAKRRHKKFEAALASLQDTWGDLLYDDDDCNDNDCGDCHPVVVKKKTTKKKAAAKRR